MLYNRNKSETLKFDFLVYSKALLELMKPRVMSLVIFTCAVGLLTSPTTIPLFDSLICIFFVTVGAGAAGALNMWYEADLDSLMTRTCLRPIPSGKINKNHALVFGIILSIASIIGLYYFSNFLSATLLFITISIYVFVVVMEPCFIISCLFSAGSLLRIFSVFSSEGVLLIKIQNNRKDKTNPDSTNEISIIFFVEGSLLKPVFICWFLKKIVTFERRSYRGNNKRSINR